jgi:hypothetical protein
MSLRLLISVPSRPCPLTRTAVQTHSEFHANSLWIGTLKRIARTMTLGEKSERGENFVHRANVR